MTGYLADDVFPSIKSFQLLYTQKDSPYILDQWDIVVCTYIISPHGGGGGGGDIWMLIL